MSRLSPTMIAVVAVAALLLIGGYAYANYWPRMFFAPTESISTLGLSSDKATPPSDMEEEIGEPIQVVATDLEIPWDIAFLPDTSLLVTERPGRLTRILPDEKKSITIEGVVHRGEGGLQGLVLDPNFTDNGYIYLYLTTRNGDQLINRIERYFLNFGTNQLSQRQVILDNIPGASYHDGGRIKFGPDGYLYVATGDAGNQDSAQDTSSLAGKILRITKDGEAAPGNPFENLVYSYGHRNVQGLTWDNQGRLWASEHGPSGLATGNDEINLIQAGNNYGWPVIRGQESQDGMETPIIESGRSETWAPAGVEILDGKLFFVGLRGESLYQATINDQNLENLTRHFSEEYGRLRFVRLGPDGWLYLGTSNTDGRGQVQQGDDKIIKIHPSIFE